jgi:hypothetical protein
MDSAVGPVGVDIAPANPRCRIGNVAASAPDTLRRKIRLNRAGSSIIATRASATTVPGPTS